MAANRREGRRASLTVALCGMAAALSAVLMLLSGVIPIATYATPLLAALLLFPVRLELGVKAGWAAWLTTAVLTLLLGLDKEAALFYAFVGWWPLVKWPLDLHIRRKGIRLLVKTGIFALCVAGMYSIIVWVLHLDAVTAELREMGVWMTAAFLAGLVVCLLLYDRLLTPLSLLYVRRFQPRVRRLLR